jgi:hypothetical protein
VELERRLQTYDQVGIVATQQVPAAARVVATENALLRTLARTQLGWTDQELARYISQELHRGPAHVLGQDWILGRAYSSQIEPHSWKKGFEQPILKSIPQVPTHQPLKMAGTGQQ